MEMRNRKIKTNKLGLSVVCSVNVKINSKQIGTSNSQNANKYFFFHKYLLYNSRHVYYSRCKLQCFIVRGVNNLKFSVSQSH
jgi:hypothetical protein